MANGSADEFQRGEQLFRMRAVKDPLQIGMMFVSYRLELGPQRSMSLIHLLSAGSALLYFTYTAVENLMSDAKNV